MRAPKPVRHAQQPGTPEPPGTLPQPPPDPTLRGPTTANPDTPP
jgi:hypothetical protein